MPAASVPLRLAGSLSSHEAECLAAQIRVAEARSYPVAVLGPPIAMVYIGSTQYCLERDSNPAEDEDRISGRGYQTSKICETLLLKGRCCAADTCQETLSCTLTYTQNQFRIVYHLPGQHTIQIHACTTPGAILDNGDGRLLVDTS